MIRPPRASTSTTGEATPGANPASETTRCAPAGTEIPLSPGAVSAPVSPQSRSVTSASTSLGLLSTRAVLRPRLREPPTSQVEPLGSTHGEAASPENPGAADVCAVAPASSTPSPAGAERTIGAASRPVSSTPGSASTVSLTDAPLAAATSSALDTATAVSALPPVSSPKRTSPPEHTRS